MAGIILTNHARDRLKERWITEDAIESVLRSPDWTGPGSKPETVKFVRTLNERKIHVVAKYLNDQKQWLILSVWVRGEDDKESIIWTILAFPFKLLAKLLFSTKRKHD